MKNMTKLFLIIVALTSLPAWALKEYYAPSRSIRAQGMGGAFYGWSNDEYALFYNPAGLSLYSGNGEGGLRINSSVGSKTISALSTLTKLGNDNIQTLVDKMTEYQGTPISARIGLLPYYFKKNFAVGLLLADTKVNFALLGKELDSSVEVTALTDSGLYVGYGRSIIVPELHVGATVKVYHRTGGTKSYTLAEISQKSSTSIDANTIGGGGAGIDADIGSTYVLPKLPIGLEHRVSLVFNNLVAAAPTIAKVGGTAPKLSRTMSLGWYSAFPGVWAIDNFHFLFDISEINLGGETNSELGARTGSIWKHINFGTEVPIGLLALRAGFHQGNLSGGLGLNLKLVRLDFSTYAEEDGALPGKLTSRSYNMSLMVGWASAPTPPVTATGVSEDVKKLEEPKKEEPKKDEIKEEPKKEDPSGEPAQPRKPNDSSFDPQQPE